MKIKLVKIMLCVAGIAVFATPSLAATTSYSCPETITCSKPTSKCTFSPSTTYDSYFSVYGESPATPGVTYHFHHALTRHQARDRRSDFINCQYRPYLILQYSRDGYTAKLIGNNWNIQGGTCTKSADQCTWQPIKP